MYCFIIWNKKNSLFNNFFSDKANVYVTGAYNVGKMHSITLNDIECWTWNFSFFFKFYIGPKLSPKIISYPQKWMHYWLLRGLVCIYIRNISRIIFATIKNALHIRLNSGSYSFIFIKWCRVITKFGLSEHITFINLILSKLQSLPARIKRWN